MATPTQTYVDPSIAADSGSGTVGDPYGDLQYALDTITRDATNGDQINIKAGTDEDMSTEGAPISLATYGTPSNTAPLIFRGYTSAANDGGIGGITGGGSYSIFNSVTSFLFFIDLHLHNTGSNKIIDCHEECVFYNCEFDNTTSHGIETASFAKVLYCHFHNIGGQGSRNLGNSCFVGFSFFKNGINKFQYAIAAAGAGNAVAFNTISIDGSSSALYSGSGSNTFINNSIYSASGTGKGVEHTANLGGVVINNIIEGFSGAGGKGLSFSSDYIFVGYNTFYNNTTDESLGDVFVDLGNDQTPASSPFTDAASDDFTVSTDVKALAFPTANYPSLSVRSYLDMGALQREEPAGGGVGQRPIFRGFTHLG